MTDRIAFASADHLIPKPPFQVMEGWLAGNFIRRARKAGRCVYWRGTSNGGACRKPINVGDLYCEGEPDDTSPNPFKRDRYCLECAGVEAIATVALQGS